MNNREIELKSRLDTLLVTFKIPNEHKNDLWWLKDNVSIQNSGHRDLNEVKQIIVALLLEKNKNRVKNLVK